MEFKNILVPTDFSFCSKQGLRFAISLAEKFSSEIIILHVLDEKLIEESCYYGLDEEREIKRKIWMKTRAKFDEFLEGESFGDIRYQKMTVPGSPFQEIIKKAQEVKADLIVIGSCGGAADLDRLFFGSTAEKVIRMLSCPVLCVPPQEI
jgi:nucleotide-binding universal stress UspA family protein